MNSVRSKCISSLVCIDLTVTREINDFPACRKNVKSPSLAMGLLYNSSERLVGRDSLVELTVRGYVNWNSLCR